MFPYHKASNILSVKEKIGQLFMPAAFINDSEEDIQKLEKLIKEHCVGGLCFFHSKASAATNYEGKQEVFYNEESFNILKLLIIRYQKAAKYPLLISIDAEWGLAMRIENTPQYPYALSLGAIQGHTELIHQMGRNIAKDCMLAGIHWNLAPVADINNNPDNPVIGYRSFGENKTSVTEKAVAYMQGMQAEGLLTSVKHFPGHGDTATDSHLGLPLIDKSKEELWQNELLPFQELINKGVDAVMVGHLSVPALAEGKTLSSSISKEMIKGLLRSEMGFKGVVISDALNMHAVSKNYSEKGQLEWLAFDAGNDILCFAEHTAEGIDKIFQHAAEAQIEASFQRIWELKEKAITNAPPASKDLTNPLALNREMAINSLSLHIGTVADVDIFKNSGFTGVHISDQDNTTFFKGIQSKIDFSWYATAHTSPEEIIKTLDKSANILIGLYPPKAKPLDNFGISEGNINLINTLITHKNVILYLFGNPYALDLLALDKLKALIIAYQDFPVFQENAAKHFLGEVIAPGKLPITLNKVLS
ncbi:glycoside hydrolase family 3 protein [Muriicola sp. Z0-33]|uniref:glycoside hydrolase family 3 protein n=1 Tax=Muriicola sp. Z0-33 TaxID=2816957 RepID=UPI002237CB7C|nr:glycoside hydrolase family 3 N-terminal domain-containing protein [Muriicola sp. Z0-33]MCW5515806.1 glycoside hydrolase family 3 protein [Muriicola sp. Z0-33]